MVNGNEVGGAPAIEGVAFASLKDMTDEGIGPVGGSEVLVVFIGVSPFVGIAEGNPHHLRMVALQRFQSVGIGEGVEALRAPVVGHALLHFVDEPEDGIRLARHIGLVGHAGWKAYAVVLNGIAD